MGERRIYESLQEITGQESGIVVHGGNYLICNWASGEGLPYVGPLGYLLHVPQKMCVVKRLRMKDIGGILEDKDCIYDRNGDRESLAGLPGKSYELNGRVLVIAPEDWN